MSLEEAQISREAQRFKSCKERTARIRVSDERALLEDKSERESDHN
jgi:CYTH domain-containing protein